MHKCLAALGIAMVLPAYAQGQQPKPSVDDQHREPRHEQTTPPDSANTSQRWYASLQRPDWWVVIVAGITGGFICWQSWETRRAANAARKQSEIATDTARRQLRAYLCVSESLVKFTDDGCLEGQVYVKNGGQTPAYDVRTWSNSIVAQYPFKEPLPTPPDGFPMAVGIVSTQEKQIIVAKKVAAPQPILDLLETPNVAYCVYGECRYKDIFDEVHSLKYRLIYGAIAGTRTRKDSNGVTIGMLVMHLEGNTED